VGDLGPAARAFADRLAEAGLGCWQTLPLNPTTPAAGESPYFSNSSRAGNPLLISLEDLADEGLLEGRELDPPARDEATAVDFSLARALKEPLLARRPRLLLGPGAGARPALAGLA
jgi:4-alpha-glucanotransferase